MSVKEHHLHIALRRIYERIKSGDPLKALREKAWDHFLELGLPEKNQEAFQYLSLRSLYDLPLRIPEPILNQKIAPSTLVFVNGFFMPELSNLKELPKKVIVLPTIEAMRSYGTFLQNRWSKTLREETDPFAVLNLALHPRGVFIYVPPKCLLSTPISCLNITEGENIFSQTRIQLFVASGAEVKWVSSSLSNGWSNTVLDLALEDGAKFDHIQTAEGGAHLQALRATLKREAKLTSLSVLGRSSMTRQSFRLSLLGERASALLQGLSLLKGQEQSHVHVLMEHVAPHCQSMQKFKAALAENSQVSFEGKILVRKEAQKTEAYQLNNNLLLGEYAIANSKPNLEIFADDVKASHGATVSQLEEEPLFYLRSRGLSQSKAKTLLLSAFCREILDQIPDPSLRDNMVSYAHSML